MKVAAPGSAETVVTISETTGCKHPPSPPLILYTLDFLSSPIWEPPHFIPRHEDIQNCV